MTRIRMTVKAVDNGHTGVKMTIPKEIQIRLGIRPGDFLDVILEHDGFFVKRQEAGN